MEVVDAGELERALADIDCSEFTTADGAAEERAVVIGDAAEALSWLIDPFAAVPFEAGVEGQEGSHSVAEVDEGGFPCPQPRFCDVVHRLCLWS